MRASAAREAADSGQIEGVALRQPQTTVLVDARLGRQHEDEDLEDALEMGWGARDLLVRVLRGELAHLTDVGLSGVSVSWRELSQVLLLLPKCSRIDCRFNNHLMADVSEPDPVALELARRREPLEHLALSHCGIRDEQFSVAFAEAVPRSIVYLDVSCNALASGDFFRRVHEASVGTRGVLRGIDVQGNALSLSACTHLNHCARSCGITQLTLGGTPTVDPMSAEAVATVLHDPPSSLTRLSLIAATLTEPCVSCIRASLAPGARVALHQCEIDLAIARDLGDSLQPLKLTALCLNRNKPALASYSLLRGCAHPGLQSLSVKNEAMEWGHFVAAFPPCTSLRRVTLQGVLPSRPSIYERVPSSWRSGGALLASNFLQELELPIDALEETSLGLEEHRDGSPLHVVAAPTHLELWDCGVTLDHLAWLLPAASPMLHTLSLGGNLVDESMGKLLAAWIGSGTASARQMRSLSLNVCQMSDSVGQTVLAAFLRAPPRSSHRPCPWNSEFELETINVACNDLGDSSLCLLAAMVSHPILGGRTTRLRQVRAHRSSKVTNRGIARLALALMSSSHVEEFQGWTLRARRLIPRLRSAQRRSAQASTVLAQRRQFVALWALGTSPSLAATAPGAVNVDHMASSD
jgi:hypothetical protein